MRTYSAPTLLLVLLLHLQCCYGAPNVLFIIADDMRPDASPYVDANDIDNAYYPNIITPNIQALADDSLLLKRAFVQEALCSPSRSSFLTGRRPDTTHVYDIVDYFRDVGGNYTTMPQYFKEKGYRSIGMGKIFHQGDASDDDDPLSWSNPSEYFHGVKNHENGNSNSWQDINDRKLARKPLRDTQIAEKANATLEELALDPDQPFFLAVGFHKPHLPFVFPEEFLNMYPLSDIGLPLDSTAPAYMPDVAWQSYSGLRSYPDISILNASGDINTTLPDATVKDLRRAYYSAITYIDSLVGGVLQKLEDEGLKDNTIVTFIGDHGFHLGEYGEWLKQTNFEIAVRAPMMIRIPGKTNGGIVSDELVEFVDLFPTLVEAAGLPQLPVCTASDSTSTELCREGTSMMPLIANPLVAIKNASFFQYPRNSNGVKCMGYSIRTDQYRYTEWVRFNYRTYTPIWTQNYGTELYLSPRENYNHAGEAAYATVQAELSEWLHAGWRRAMLQ